jgi:aminotransferase EvaB
MSIKVWSYLDEYHSEKTTILQSIEEVLASGMLILGDKVRDFEKQFSSYCGCDFGVGVNSATDALFLAMKTLNIGEGDEVITVSNTAVPTVSAIVATGATPVFVDIDPITYLMDVTKIRNVITKNTKCIIPVHLFGQCVNMGQLYKDIEGFDIKVIEDCSQSHGAKFENKMC